MLEGQIRLDLGQGQVSQSFQIAPFDDHYEFNNATGMYTLYNPDKTYWNTYKGGEFQQAVSALTMVQNDLYISQKGATSGQFGAFGFEYASNSADRSKGYVTWVSEGQQSWTMNAGAVGPNPRTGVGQRVVTEEPMALVRSVQALSPPFLAESS